MAETKFINILIALLVILGFYGIARIFHRHPGLDPGSSSFSTKIHTKCVNFILTLREISMKRTGSGPAPRMTTISFYCYLILIFIPFYTHANPWLPERGGWKYSLQYSKDTTPKSIKFYEIDLYFQLARAQALLGQQLSQDNNTLSKKIALEKFNTLNIHQTYLNSLSLQNKQQAIDQYYAQNQSLQILYQNQQNNVTDTDNKIRALKQLQNLLITSYHTWNMSSAIEYGVNEHMSYGISGNIAKEVDKYHTKKRQDNFATFVKAKVYDQKGYVITLQPKFLNIGGNDGFDMSIMFGKSHMMKRKVFNKKVEVFGYSSLGITNFLNNNMLKKRIHTEITSGIKWNDRTILMAQESEDLNPSLNKTYKRVQRSQFTIAQDLNFASMDPRNKVYLTLSYFMIDSVKARRRLSSGYSIGLWLEF